MSISFITATTASILEKAKGLPESFNVPNDHPCFNEEQVSLWKQLATLLDIDYAATKHTIRVVTKPDGRSLFTPYVASDGKQAVLVWGEVKKPLSEITKQTYKDADGNSQKRVELSIEGDKRSYLSFAFPELDYEALQMTMMFAKGDKEDSPQYLKDFAKADDQTKKATVTKALRQGKLHEYLSQSFERAKKLGAIAGRSVEVYGYSINRFGKYEMVTSEGLIVGNTAIAKKLDQSPVISREFPATLEVGISTRKTSSGNDIFPATLTTHADQELPEFDFGMYEEVSDEGVDFAA